MERPHRVDKEEFYRLLSYKRDRDLEKKRSGNGSITAIALTVYILGRLLSKFFMKSHGPELRKKSLSGDVRLVTPYYYLLDLTKRIESLGIKATDLVLHDWKESSKKRQCHGTSKMILADAVE